MDNPFEDIMSELAVIREKIENIQPGPAVSPVELITQDELCKRLDITPATAITWRKQKKIPFIKIGASVRFNWAKVVEALESKTKKK